jgi:hypothetical protein
VEDAKQEFGEVAFGLLRKRKKKGQRIGRPGKGMEQARLQHLASFENTKTWNRRRERKIGTKERMKSRRELYQSKHL